MKQLLILFITLLTTSLTAQTKTADEFLKTIEQGISFDVFNNAPDVRFKQNKITSRISSKKISNSIHSSGGIAKFQNLNINGSLQLVKNDFNIKKLIFINCSFEDSIFISTINIPQHIAFLGCRFKKNVLLNDLSTKSMTFIANEFNCNFKFTALHKNNVINDFLFAMNHLKNLSLEANNIFINCPYSGTIEINDAAIMSNSAEKAFLSAVKVNKNIFAWFNLINEIEYNSVFTNGFIGFKYNLCDVLKLQNQFENDQANFAISNNIVGELNIKNYFLKYFLFTQNRISTIDINSFKSYSSLGLRDNIFSSNAKIVLNACDAYKLNFRQQRDSIYVLQPDTLNAEEADTSTEFSPFNPIFKDIHSNSANTNFLKFNVKNIAIPDNNDDYSISFYNSDINRNNWLVNFETIKRKGKKYRINPSDTVLSKRHEIYSSIQSAYKEQGNWEQADACYYEWKELERKNYFKYSQEPFFTKLVKTVFNNLNWISCGYGIKPLRIFPFAFFIILFFGIVYYFTPQPISNLEYFLISSDKIKKRLSKLPISELKNIFKKYDFDFEIHKQDLIDNILSSIDSEKLIEILEMKPKSRYNLEYFWNCFYFSFSTFTTVGIGDWYPSGKINKAIVMVEGSLGWLSLGLFITTYANILLR